MSWQQAIKAAQIEDPRTCDPNLNWIEKSFVQFCKMLLQERGRGGKPACECQDGGKIIQIHEEETHNNGLQDTHR